LTEQTELKLSYSVGMKVNVGNYQSVDVHLSEARTFDVTGEDADAIDNLSITVYNELREKIDNRLTEAVNEVKN
jgi:tRNA(Phe) wybutosine-synthesizing methylase Tyw3